MFDERTSVRPSTSERRHAETRRKVLDTTLEMIHEKGIDKVSWRGIARAVNYSPAGLYEYFDNKDDIVAALAREGLERLDRAMQVVDESKPLELRLMGLGEAYIRYAHEHPAHFHLVFSALPSARRSRTEPPTGAYKRLMAAMQEGVETKRLHARSAADAETLAYGFWGLVHGLASLQLTALRGFDADFSTADHETIATFIRGLQRTVG